MEQAYPMDDNILRYGDPIEVDAPQDMNQSGLQSRKKQQLPPLDQKLSIEEILNTIFPPKTFEVDEHHFNQPVSVVDAVRDELRDLDKLLDLRLEMRQARKNGICPVREDLHSQLFDEIIRQSTINCPERGLLLVKVRDNLRMTFAAYQTLYAGSIVFGVKKAIQSEVGISELEAKIAELDKKKIQLENKVQSRVYNCKKIIMENELDSIQKSFKEIRDLEEKRRDQELNYLKHQTKHLETFLKQVQQSTS